MLANNIRKFSVNAPKIAPGTLSIVEAGLKYVGGGILAPFALLGYGWLNVPLNHCAVVQRFGKFESLKQEGLHYILPLGANYNKIFMGSLSYKLDKSQITDLNGNPLIVSAIVNYQIEHPEEFISKIKGANNYIFNQAESSIKKTVSKYPYESDDGIGLKSENDQIVNEMKSDLQIRLDGTGIKVNDVRLTDMNYAPEIASLMLQKQQAKATLVAKEYLVKGAVEMVEDVKNSNVGKDMNQEQQSKLITNLMSLLISNTAVQPVIPLNNF
jgi:regulator of protease activity HflC (stomatin/prohibitin superfamily)